jgi:IclR family pca regulon transcriptional regulator
VQSLHRGLDVLRAFGAGRPRRTLAELATETGLSRAVVRRLLLTLEHLGFIRRDGREFALTPRVLELGYRYLSSLSVAELGLPVMEGLAHALHESCSLGVLDGTDVVYVQRVAVRKILAINLGVGTRLPAYCTSMGRVLIAGQPQAVRGAWLARVEPVARTRFTVADRAALTAAIDEVARRGHAYVEQELELGLCSLAVPVHDAAGETVAALNVGMPFTGEARLRAREVVLPALRAAAREISQTLSARSAAR